MDVNDQSFDADNQISREDITAFIDGLTGKLIPLYDGYESAFVGVVKFAPPESEFVTLYDFVKCVEITGCHLGYDMNTEEAFLAEDTFSSGLSSFFQETDPIFLHWWNSDDEGVSYLDGYESAFVGLIGSNNVALYDWKQCIEILLSDLGEENKSQAEDKLSSTARELFRETDPAFLFRFPGVVTSEELNDLYAENEDELQ